MFQIAYQSPQASTQPMTELPFVDLSLVVLAFSLGDDPIACLNKAMAFLTAVASSRFPLTNNQLRTTSNLRNQVRLNQDGRVTVSTSSGEARTKLSGTGYKGNATSSGGNNASGQARVVKCYNCQGEGHMSRQCNQPKRPRNAAWFKDKEMLVEAQEAGQILDEEQLAFLVDPGILDGQAVQTIIPNNVAFQTEDLDTYDSDCDDISNAQAVLMASISNYGSDVISEAQQDSMILSVIEQMSEQMINYVNNWEKANKEQNHESVTAELKRYKERVKTFEQHLNIDLSSHEKMIDSQMDDMIKEKLALKEQVDLLEQNLSKQIKEKESLLQTFTVLKNESKEKENKYMENEIDLEKKIKRLDNIIYKVGQSTQTVHMLTKPQAFYDNIHKQALGYQNLFYLKKAQRIKPTLYEELSAEQAFWFRMSNPTIESSDKPPVKVEVPGELPKMSLVNASLNKLKLYLAQFDSVVKKRTTPNARIEGIFNIFDKALLNEIMEVQTVFNQIEASVLQSLVEKKCLEIAKKELLLENDRILQKIMSQDVLLTVINSMSLNGESVNIGIQRSASCDKCFSLDTEISKSQNAHNYLLKSQSQLEKHCISLELSIQLNQEIFQEDKPCDNQNTLEIPDYFENNNLKAQLQDKDTTICKLKEIIQSLRGTNKEENVNHDRCELETINEELENRLKCSTSKCRSKPTCNKKNDRILRTPSRNMKNKVEVQPRKVNKKNRVVEPIRDANVKHSLLNANSELVCDTCNKWNRSQLMNFVSKFLGTVRFGNDQIARIMGYGDFSTGKCYYLQGSRDTNLYTISLDDMLKASPICLISKVSKTKSWLWHRRLSHLNFGTLNKLAKDGLARGIPKLKFQKDHLCSAYALGKSKKSSHQLKAEDTNQEKLYLLHMDLCGPMRVESINGKKYILAEAINTACYTQNRSLIHLRYNKTPYELMHDKKPDLSFFHVFGSLCYPTNDSEDLGKLNAKAGLVPKIIPQQPCNPPKRDDWDTLFQSLFDEYFIPPTIVVFTVPVAASPRAVEIANSPVSTSIDQDAP
ncbi:integrase, catalytic region, zinc finger, CCHC-type containing protein, partial [Tanacetum coccineum]